METNQPNLGEKEGTVKWRIVCVDCGGKKDCGSGSGGGVSVVNELDFTVGQNIRVNRLENWAIRSSVRSFARNAHSFACSGLLHSLAPSAALTRSPARSLRSLLARGKVKS